MLERYVGREGYREIECVRKRKWERDGGRDSEREVEIVFACVCVRGRGERKDV